MTKQLVRDPPGNAVASYAEDPYAWTLAQVALLRARRFDELDLENLIEEVEGLARSHRSAVLNSARDVVEHLLKLEYSPAVEPRNGWRATVREHRQRLELDLTKTLRRELGKALPRVYRLARSATEGALRDHGEDGAALALPPTCPFGLDQVTADWWPSDPHKPRPGTAEARPRGRTLGI